MPRGRKSKYTDKQERKAKHIEKGYEDSGLSEKEAKRRAWATVNKLDKGGKNPGGSGRGKKAGNGSSRRSSSNRRSKKSRASSKRTPRENRSKVSRH